MGLAGSVSRPSSSRDLFRLRSQELMVGWLRAFCRSPTFWPSSVLTLLTLRFFKGSGGPALGPRGDPAALTQGVSRGEVWQNQPGEVRGGGALWVPLDLWPRAPRVGQPAPRPPGPAPRAHLQRAGVQVGEGVDVHGDVGLGQALQLLCGGTA